MANFFETLGQVVAVVVDVVTVRGNFIRKSDELVLPSLAFSDATFTGETHHFSGQLLETKSLTTIGVDQ